MDTQEHNGWPNRCTWQLFTHLTSYQETYDVARSLTQSAPSVYRAADVLREWVQAVVEEWFEVFPSEWMKLLLLDLTTAALAQVDWDKLARAFREE
jgi:hypothetical protein